MDLDRIPQTPTELRGAPPRRAEPAPVAAAERARESHAAQVEGRSGGTDPWLQLVETMHAGLDGRTELEYFHQFNDSALPHC